MAKTKVALTLDADLIDQVDELVERRRFRNRSQAVEDVFNERSGTVIAVALTSLN